MHNSSSSSSSMHLALVVNTTTSSVHPFIYLLCCVLSLNLKKVYHSMLLISTSTWEWQNIGIMLLMAPGHHQPSSTQGLNKLLHPTASTFRPPAPPATTTKPGT
jgi:hypothetical protein